MTKNGYPKLGTRTPEAKAQREAHWRAVLNRWRVSGLAKTEFARREQISSDLLGWWHAEIQKRDRARRRPAPAARSRRADAPRPTAFVPVRVVEPASAPSPAALEILAGGHTVRVRPGFDSETLRRLVGVLEERP
jgi:hypothetical protein